MHTILDEIIFGGQVLETSSTEVMKAVEEVSKCSLFPLVFSMVFLSHIILLNKKVIHHSSKLVTKDFSLSAIRVLKCFLCRLITFTYISFVLI